MSARNYLIGLWLIASFVSETTAAQKPLSPESVRSRGLDAFRELARDLPPEERRRAEEAIHRALDGFDPGKKTGAEAVAAAIVAVDRQLRLQHLELHSDSKSLAIRKREVTTRDYSTPNPRPREKQFVAIRPPIERILESIARRQEIIADLGARELRELDARATGDESLREFLKSEQQLDDYAAVASSFNASAKVKWIELRRETTLLRLFGNKSRPLGRYLFCCLERSEDPPSIKFIGPFTAWTDARGLALPPENSLSDLATVRLPVGTRALIGTVADNFADKKGTFALGGNTQIFVPGVKDFPYERYHQIGGTAAPDDILVILDNDRVVRFRP